MAVVGEPVLPNVTNPKEGIEYANNRIKLLEEMSKAAREKGDLATSSRCEGHIVKWAQILQFFIRQDWQMGGSSTDASKGISRYSERQRRKKRFQ